MTKALSLVSHSKCNGFLNPHTVLLCGWKVECHISSNGSAAHGEADRSWPRTRDHSKVREGSH